VLVAEALVGVVMTEDSDSTATAEVLDLDDLLLVTVAPLLGRFFFLLGLGSARITTKSRGKKPM